VAKKIYKNTPKKMKKKEKEKEDLPRIFKKAMA